METITRNPSKKTNARKMAAKATTKAKAEAPVVDVPNSQQKQINEYVKTNQQKIADYMTQHFDEVGADEVALITREAAECAILKRSPKKGSVWGDDVTIIEDVIKHVAGPTVAVVEPTEVDHGEPPVGDDIESHHGDAPEEEDGEQEESEPVAESDEIEDQEEEPTPKALASEPSSPAKKSKTKSKTKPVKTASQKKATPTKPKAVDTKKAAKEKPASTAPKSDRTPSVSADQIKKLKGKEQWFAAARLLKSQKKLWIQTQDIPEVIGHIYDVAQGKAKLKEEGFDGKGEKVYRKNRILGFKETIEGFLKGLK